MTQPSGTCPDPSRQGGPMLQTLMTEFLENLAITLADYAQCKA